MDYPFARLDDNDLAEVQSLESKLSNKLGRSVILIAYEHGVGQAGAQGLTALADGAEPEEYGEEQVSQETGLRM